MNRPFVILALVTSMFMHAQDEIIGFWIKYQLER